MVSVALDLNPDVISTLSMDSDYSSIIEIESITLIDAFGQKTGNRYPTRFARYPANQKYHLVYKRLRMTGMY